MPAVDPEDDTLLRYVVFWYRYDPLRRERRPVVVVAFDTEHEFSVAVDRLHDDLQQLKQAGKADDVERISGSVRPPGYQAKMRSQRQALKRFRTRRTRS